MNGGKPEESVEADVHQSARRLHRTATFHNDYVIGGVTLVALAVVAIVASLLRLVGSAGVGLLGVAPK